MPVINENDTVATAEIRYGDNDRLAARVATMVGADCLVLLSDVDGLYTAPPATRPGRPLHRRRRGDHAGDRGDGRRRRLGAVARRHADQDRGRQDRDRAPAARWSSPAGDATHPAAALDAGRALHLVRAAVRRRSTARKRWIAGTLEPRGALIVDAGAAARAAAGKSLLPAGVTRVEGASRAATPS